MASTKKKGKSSCCSCCCFPCCSREGTAEGRADTADDATHIASIKTRGKNRKSERSKCKRCCLRLLAFLFSHIGMSCVVVGYCALGGFLFEWLESDSETMVRADIKNVRDDHIQELWERTKAFNVLHEGNWTLSADQIMKKFQQAVYVAVKEKGWDGKEESAPGKQWSFTGSLLYSVTVITTIGYGHIAPKTEFGRLATMLYALIGIPITLLFLANIGGFFGNCFRFFYKHSCNAVVWLCCPNHVRRTSTGSSKKNASPVTPALPSSSSRSNCKQQMTFVNEKKSTKTIDRRPATLTTEPDLQKTNTGGSDFPDNRSSLDSKDTNVLYDQSPNHYEDIRGDSEQAMEAHPKIKTKRTLKQEVRVPMFVSLLIAAGYVFGGAVMFSVWEEDWNYLIGAYFCFTTLSTIGFGDFVFGAGGDWDDNGKLIMCALYLVFGLAIIAMCFDLMQEEAMAKFRWLGKKLGIIESEEEND